jgi:hypothetical protein
MPIALLSLRCFAVMQTHFAADWVAITAVTTGALALATFAFVVAAFLQRSAMKDAAEASSRAAAASERAAEAGARQTDLIADRLDSAQEALRAATRPLLADVPRDEDDLGTQIHASVGWEHDEEVYASVPLRNVGAGPAVLVDCRLAASKQAMDAQQWAPGHAPQNVIAPGERVRVHFEARPGSPGYSTLLEQIVRCVQVVMEIRYRDLAEDHRAALTADLVCHRSEQEWRVSNSEVLFEATTSVGLSPTVGRWSEA